MQPSTSQTGGMDSRLADFLRTRRAATDPRRSGLPVDDGRPRRVPGLRREELAALAHVSIDYIVRLEQGRTRRVSRPVLDALADALRLASDERDYLYAVADVAPAVSPRPSRPDVVPELRQLLDTMHDVPALVLHRGMDVLAWNSGAAALLTDFGALEVKERNLIRLTFLDPEFRALYADWPGVARECVAVLRMEAGRHPGDPSLAALVSELSARDADFRTWWASHRVRGPRRLRKEYRHPMAGDLILDVQQFSVDTDPSQMLVAYTAEPGSPSFEKLQKLRWPLSPSFPAEPA